MLQLNDFVFHSFCKNKTFGPPICQSQAETHREKRRGDGRERALARGLPRGGGDLALMREAHGQVVARVRRLVPARPERPAARLVDLSRKVFHEFESRILQK